MVECLPGINGTPLDVKEGDRIGIGVSLLDSLSEETKEECRKRGLIK